MNQIAVIGFGEQGIKSVAALSGYQYMLKKFFVDNDLNILNQYDLFGQGIPVDFYYREEVWDPGDEIKLWLEDEDHKNYILNFIKDFSMLIFVTGLGGTMSLMAKELAAFFMKEEIPIPVYFVCSLTFRAETDYKHNFLARRVLQFLRKEEFGWTVIENDRILPIYNYDFSWAYEESYRYLTYMMECIFSLFGTGIWNSKIDFSEIAALLGKGLTHIAVFEAEGITPDYSEVLKNDWLPYLPNPDSNQVLMSLEISNGVRLPGILKQIDRVIENFFSGDCSCSCRIYHGQNPTYAYKIILVSSGMESKENKISVREICLD